MDTNGLNRELIDSNVVRVFQTGFSKHEDVAIICIDAEGELIYGTGKIPGVTDDIDWCNQLMESEVIKELVDRVGEDSLEDITFQHAYADDKPEGLHLAAVSMKISGKKIATWILLAEGAMPEKIFVEKADFIRNAVGAFYSGKYMQLSASIEGGITPDKELEKSYRTLEATTSVVKLLDTNVGTEQVMQKWVEIVRDYLGIDFASVLRINPDGATMDVLAEAKKSGIVSHFESIINIKSYSFMNSQVPLVISSESIDDAVNANVAAEGITAIALLPLLSRADGSGSMYVSLEYRTKPHNWDMDELKFVSDATRILQNALASRITRNSLAGSLRALEEILNNVGVSVYLTSRETGEVIFYNRILMETFSEEWENGWLRIMVSNGAFSNGSADKGSFEIFNSRHACWYEVIYKPVEWVDGSEANLYSLTNITDHKLYQRKIERQAFTDFLTGLYNRMCCERDLARIVDATKKDGTHGALIYLDLDDFKHINDGIGHQYGDILLKSISNAMRGVNGIENTCYRMGGDEFVILVPPAAYPRLDGVLEDIKKIFSSPWYLKDGDYYCTTSIGVVSFPDHGDSVQDLIKKADIAMYEAKKSGKNRMAFYSEGQDSSSGRRLDMEKNMRDAESTDYEEFLVYYQPIIEVENGEERCVGAEALVRWDNEQLGFMSPIDFIPLAEYLGLVNPIGDHVLRVACKTCKKWHDLGYDYMKVNVNLSVVQLLQNNIVELIEEAIKLSGIDPKFLTLEVTESLAINDMARMIGILTRIKDLGVSIALDDFGTGYSSLNHIREIPFDIIKVDQSFVKDLAENAYSQAFVKMVAELAETIGVKICVEGIETKEQYDVVKTFKIKYLQGYYFDKPLTQRAFEERFIK